jgi:hypothetical protein
VLVSKLKSQSTSNLFGIGSTKELASLVDKPPDTRKDPQTIV